MANNKPIHTQQIYEKICAIETNLNRLLESSDMIAAGTLSPVQNRPVYLATAGPEAPLSVICLDDAADYLPCFDEADMLYGLPEVPIIMSYCPGQVMDIGKDSYLVGPMIFFRTDRNGDTVSLTVDDLYWLADYLESHRVTLMADGKACIAIQLD